MYVCVRKEYWVKAIFMQLRSHFFVVDVNSRLSLMKFVCLPVYCCCCCCCFQQIQQRSGQSEFIHVHKMLCVGHRSVWATWPKKRVVSRHMHVWMCEFIHKCVCVYTFGETVKGAHVTICCKYAEQKAHIQTHL